jgi:hypothetical protein
MAHSAVPDDVRRFVLTSIASVPHLEALLLLQRERQSWSSAEVATRLYLPESVVAGVLADLCASNLIECEASPSAIYRFRPASDDLARMTALLADLYAVRLIEITHLVHSKDDRRAQQFVDAFKLRKDS